LPVEGSGPGGVDEGVARQWWEHKKGKLSKACCAMVVAQFPDCACSLMHTCANVCTISASPEKGGNGLE
jgi:hypothetical protein